MENTFATFKPIELNPSPSKEEIANYYLENNMSTSDEFLDNFLKIPTPVQSNSPVPKSSPNIKELLAVPIPKIKRQTYDNSTDKGRYILNYLVNKGLSKEQAAGIVGNLHAESSLNTEALGDNGTSFGIAQWHKDRWDGLKQFATQSGRSTSDLDTQLEYLWNELQTSEIDAFQKLLRTSTPNESAKVFAKEFERMKDYSSQREVFANMYYNQI